MIMPKKWEAIASDPAHFGGNRREAVERCYLLHCEPPRELTDDEIKAIFRKYNWSDGDPDLMKTTRDIIAAHVAKQREPETLTFRAAKDKYSDQVAMLLVDTGSAMNNWEWLEPAQTIEVVVP